MKYLLDTDICIDVLRGRSEAVQRIKTVSPSDVRVSVITRFELMCGVERCSQKHKEDERQKVERFLQLIIVLPMENQIADRAARLRKQLSALETPMGPYDLLIAATALECGHTLVSNNQKEFSRIPELSLDTWF